MYVFFSAAAVVLSPLVVIELIVRICFPYPTFDFDDPYVSFIGLRSLFVLDESGQRYETAEERYRYFCPQSFEAKKGPDTFRIFCLGGSTVQGRPYHAVSSFTAWLQFNLQAARPETNWEVVNCGGISYASYRLVPILRETLRYEPDLYIICTGHNEFLEDRTYQRIKQKPRILLWLHQVLLSLHTYSHAYKYLSPNRALRTDGDHSSKTVLPTEIEAKLDQHNGWNSYHRDETWRADVIEHFNLNLETMIRICRGAGTPVILMNPVSNLKDCPPFKSEFNFNLSERHINYIIDLWDQADALDESDVQGKMELLKKTASIDHRHAGLLYQMGKCCERLERYSDAKHWYIQAKEEDICPLRMLEPMHEIVLKTASQYRLPLVNMKALFEEQSEHDIPGAEWLLDHVHPNIKGHQLIADELYTRMEEMNLVQTPAHWRSIRDEFWEEHLSKFDESYYEDGAQTLENMREWGRGRFSNPFHEVGPMGDK